MTISMKVITTTALISFGTVLLSGCSGFVKPPKGSPTMAQVYQAGNQGQTSFEGSDDNRHLDEPNNSSLGSTSSLPSLSSEDGSSINGASSANNAQIVNALNSQFPTLPNPQNLGYVFGHYAGADSLPVPGHFVTFPMYDKIHYALPNEIQTPYNDGQFTR